MLDAIIEDKRTNGYKNTSKILLSKEVDIMTQIIIRPDSKGIHVLYVYDALYVILMG